MSHVFPQILMNIYKSNSFLQVDLPDFKFHAQIFSKYFFSKKLTIIIVPDS